MKKYMEIIVQFKFVWGLFFTGSIIIYTIINMLLGKTSMDFITVWQFILLTITLTFIYYLIFGEFILKTLHVRYKVLVHFLLSYMTLLIGAHLLKWIDTSNVSHLGLFTIGCIILYLAVSLSFFMYYKSTGEQLNKKLALYKRQKSGEEKHND
ncbi:DUF3021 family protein [Cellulosilyticum sp. I15G10I2]|uniref:DUF3021 family protein n=1 Tax=Cellulosilyticum sp. I15G10I2 TaxID=1892843 RepID=UPI00085C10E2|nr:DUF3021 family protein [Cellulosilyticum sp. I15G10I2]